MPEPLPFTRTVVKSVRKLRQSKDISAERLAQLMTESGYPITRGSITSAETERIKEVSIDWLWAASFALGVPVKTILWGPSCLECSDNPPSGFTCNSCGVST